MKIVLLRPNFGSYFQITPPLSLGYLSSSLKLNGYSDIELIDASLEKLGPEKVIERLNFSGVRPDLIGIQVYTGSQNWTKEFISRYKQINNKTKIAIGGPHISGLKEYALDYINADFGVIGEGENSIVGLVKLIEGKIHENEIEGLMYRKNGKWRNADIPYGLLKNADFVPFPDWELLKPQKYFKYMESVSMPLRGNHPVPILTSRGCPYNCTFCSSGVTNQKIMRYRSPKNIVEEMKYLKKSFKADELFISDDNFTMDLDRAEEIFNLMIKEKVNLNWRAPNGLRVDRLNEKIVHRMADSGCYYVGLGIESGSQNILKQIKKNINPKIIEGKINLLHKYDIKTSGFFIIGLRGESEMEVNETISFALSLPLDRIQVCNFVPYPGSEDFNKIFKAKSKVKYRKQINDFQKKGIIPKFREIDLKRNYRLQQKMMLMFYLRPKILFQMIKGIKKSQIVALFRHPFFYKWTNHSNDWYDD